MNFFVLLLLLLQLACGYDGSMKKGEERGGRIVHYALDGYEVV